MLILFNTKNALTQSLVFQKKKIPSFFNHFTDKSKKLFYADDRITITFRICIVCAFLTSILVNFFKLLFVELAIPNLKDSECIVAALQGR